MRISDVIDYSTYPDGTVFTLLHEGDSYGKEKGTVLQVVKIGDSLVEVNPSNFYCFSEKDTDGYEFSIVR